MTTLLSLDTAVALHLAAIRERDEEAARKQRQEAEERDARIFTMARRLQERIAQDENIDIDPWEWLITEEGYHVDHYSYRCTLNLDNPGLPFFTDDDDDNRNISGVTISGLNIKGYAPDHYINRKHSPWCGYHKSNCGNEFSTFIAAYTFAKTGRK